ncbi:SigE family RNA polymerase sigma factor [Acidothermaceae bacterium B102]|nr:SigE family RNA polymerase sigma factor [Acidothermaceae bacterium B102]
MPQEPQGFHDFVVVRRHGLLRTARLLTGDQYAAEDLTQAALERVWPRWERIVADGEPYAYVRKVMVNTYTSWWRRAWRAEQPTQTLPELVDLEDEYAATDLHDAFLRLLATLSPRQRAVLVLRFHEDLTEAATAEALGCSIGTVKSQTARALTKLRLHTDPRLAMHDS